MVIRFYSKVKNQKVLAGIKELLALCDKEFVPPLSARKSTSQTNLLVEADGQSGIDQYYNEIQTQSAFVAIEDKKVIGFMSFKRDYICEEISPEFRPNLYITTIIVDPRYRKRGITNQFYDKLMHRFEGYHIFTRTWSTNQSHMRILSSLKFYEHRRKENDRGPGIDTIYYHYTPLKRNIRQTIHQYHLGNSFILLALLILLTIIFLVVWFLTDAGMIHELAIAFSTSLLASALCLTADLALKYQDSKNDDYINRLKSYGIENLLFHKDELLESVIPTCRHEIWISGFRLIMTGKQSFRRALCKACENAPKLEIRILAAPPWSTAYQLVYGEEDVIDNYLIILRDICEAMGDHKSQLKVYFTEKPLFNDTYKVDDRFVTGPYLHCSDGKNKRITAKDFFSLDITDPSKELYQIIERDYVTVWEECTERLAVELYAKAVRNMDFSKMTKEEKWELMKKCIVRRDDASR